MNRCIDCGTSIVRRSTRCMRCANIGERNPNYRGGRSAQPYLYKQDQRKRYPERIRAREMARLALKAGRLVRKPCEFCGDENVVMHHDDYSKPLNVRFLCETDHRKVHNGMKFHTKGGNAL